MGDLKEFSVSIIKRAAARREQALAESKAIERETSTCRYKLLSWCGTALLIYVAAFVALLVAGVPPFYPRDLEALGYIAMAALAMCLMLGGSLVVDEWVKNRVEDYWFWRLLTIALWLAIGGALLYGIVISASYWLPHFR